MTPEEAAKKVDGDNEEKPDEDETMKPSVIPNSNDSDSDSDSDSESKPESDSDDSSNSKDKKRRKRKDRKNKNFHKNHYMKDILKQKR